MPAPKQLGYIGFIEGFDWKLFPQTGTFLHKQVARFLRKNPFAAKLSNAMKKKTSTRFFDWIDHIALPEKNVRISGLRKLGFERVDALAPPGTTVYKHRGSVFFPVLVHPSDEIEIVLKSENIEDFVKKVKHVRIDGEKLAPLRKCIVDRTRGYVLSAVERRGTNDFIVTKCTDKKAYIRAAKVFTTRPRAFDSDSKGIDSVKRLVKKVLRTLSTPRAADAFFRAERAYWQSRNKAGHVQKKRQDKLGLGWGNHDHHTYRSSRQDFTRLIRIFEDLGFLCRERFFAGEKAGWGAQILEHPQCDIVLFADLDITRAEKDKDFAHKGLKPTKKYGTVGLWVELHGESIVQSGMHHLEARFDFHALRRDLKKHQVGMMPPFSNFPFLKQAFTVGETWKVKRARLEKLLKSGGITEAQYQQFATRGALGSHMENLQRKQGFKGFNQDSVTTIIKATDPRKPRVIKGA